MYTRKRTCVVPKPADRGVCVCARARARAPATRSVFRREREKNGARSDIRRPSTTPTVAATARNAARSVATPDGPR